MASSKIKPIVQHIASCLQLHRGKVTPGVPTTPLFVAFQGPQGSGKTFLTTQLRQTLSAAPYNLAVAVLSIDDLYLSHDALLEVARQHPHNALLAGRGQPGTHDVKLGRDVLRRLRRINGNHASDVDNMSGEARGGPGVTDAEGVRLPAFDKSLFNGEGDRAEGAGLLIKPPLDVVLFEGWCVGFCPSDIPSIRSKYSEPIPDLEGILNISSLCREEDILEINEKLHEYVEWWDFFDAFVQIKPPDETPYSLIYNWRLQQEHDMKARNGGKGMTDEQVKRFVDRYIPGYVFFGEGVTKGLLDASGIRRLPRWAGSGLSISIDEKRELVRTASF